MAYYYQIESFLGIQQQSDGALLPVGSARDARNCCTWDGNLSVGKGYVHHIASPVPGTERILKLVPLRGVEQKFYVVTEAKVCVFKGGAWATLYTFGTPLATKDIGYVQTLIGDVRYLLIATGGSRILKIKLSDDTVAEFGAGLYSFEGTVFFWTAETRTLRLNAALSSEAVRHISIDGVTISGKWYQPKELTSYEGDTIVLAAAPETAPAVGETVTVRGGGSEASCNFLGMYYGRLVASGDPAAPSRLYWSAVAGDGRTVEDWLSVDASIDASGGYVEVGNESNDPIIGMCVLPSQVLIFKRLSVWRLYGDRPSAYALECIERCSEEMSSAGIVVKFGTPYFMTATGLKTIGDGLTDAFGGTRYLNEFLPLVASVSHSRGAHADNRMYFSVKLSDDSVYDDAMVEMDFATGSIMIRDGFQIADAVGFNGRLLIVDGERYVCRFNEGTSYAGAPINAYWKTQPTDLKEKPYQKRIKEMHMRCSPGSNVIVKVRADDATRTVPRRVFDVKSGYTKFDFNADWARVFSVEFRNENGGQFSINGGIDVMYEKEER